MKAKWTGISMSEQVRLLTIFHARKQTLMRSLWLLATCLIWVPALPAQAQPTTVILVRHAEKEAQPADNPPLSAQGRKRVEALIEAVRQAGVTSIYSTPYARTLETARGVAQVLELPVIETPIPNRSVPAYGDSVAARVRRAGGVILVVGHSNTMGAVIKALGGPEIAEIPDTEYGNLFVLTVEDGQPVRMLRAKF
ncbi:MAG TPA: phosphoglycerate mutase family protein [Burkholderiales bacterium]|nr:phosphoglycerate mutase family protein [Burkholderiales bacterium]